MKGVFFWRRGRTEGGSKIIKTNIFELRYVNLGSHVVLHQI